jgi:cysteine desulfurase
MGVPADLARSSIRFSLGRWTTAEQIEYVATKVTTALPKLRAAGANASRTPEAAGVP